MAAPIASLEEPPYIPTTSADPTTVDATFPGTDLACFAYTGSYGDRLRDRLGDLTREPNDTEPCRVFPGPQPVSIDRSHFETVRQQRYAIAPKTDGVRAAMMVTDIDGIHTVTIWDRTLSTAYGIFIENVPRVMYQVGTVMDGEIVFDRQRSRWTYLIFDVFLLNGLPQYHKDFWERLRCVSITLKHAYTETHSDSVSLSIKPFVSLHEAPLPGQEQSLDTPSFPSDGYILMPIDCGVIFGHHNTFFKLKTVHSIDFTIKGDAVFVFNSETKRMVKSGVCRDAPPVPDGSIIECTLSRWSSTPAKREWHYLGTRTDKGRSNTLFVLNKTLLNMEENLGYADIRALAPTQAP